VTEQLRLDEVLRERRAVDGDERGVAARSAGMQRSCEQLLAGACLADDQNGRVTVRQQAGGSSQHCLDGVALAHDRGERGLAPVRSRPGPRPSPAHRGGDGGAEDLEIVRQREVVARPPGHELHRHASPRIRTDDQGGQARADCVGLEPLGGVPLGAPRRDDDGRRLGPGRDGVGRADDVDRGTQVPGEVVPECLERL